MKILNPNNETHTIILQPRFTPTTTLVLELTNEVTKVKTTFNIYTKETYPSEMLPIWVDLLDNYLETGGFLVQANNPFGIWLLNSGVLTIPFDLEVKESDRYTIKLTENDIVIFRDKVFCTDQSTQDYKITKNKFIYG